MPNADTMKNYRADLREALNDQFLRETLDRFAVAYRANRQAVFADLNEKELIAQIAAVKDASLARMDELYLQFKAEAEKRGVTVHRAQTAAEANRIIQGLAKDNNCRKIIKAKSMTSEETLLNHELLKQGLDVVESDLGEWIIQLRHEGPSHMVMPAIHLSRGQVADLFTEATGRRQAPDIPRLVKVARRALRPEFASADLGLSGANFAIAENGAIGICTNEGNGRLVTTLPRVHVTLCGLDKLLPTLGDALKIIQILPRNATGQAITSYVSWISGAAECLAGPGGGKIMHIIFLDNGRTALAKDPVCGQALRCVRCGACANVCPVYRLVGGHKLGHIYIGAIGLILTYFFHGRDKARHLLQNCINCEACQEVCAAGIKLPALIQELRARLNEENGAPLEAALLGKVLVNRKLFHTLLKFGQWAQKPVTLGGPYVRHLPSIFSLGQDFRALPAIAERSFRDRWPKLAPGAAKGQIKTGLFAGCAQDFIYPEHLESALKLMTAKNCQVRFPLEQSCCGLPVQMMGRRREAAAVAKANIEAFEDAGCDYIVTLCASCASHMRNAYPRILAGEAGWAARVEAFGAKIKDFSSFITEVAGLKAQDLTNSGQGVCYHSPCHLGRGLGVSEPPRQLIKAAGKYCPTDEEDVCCGFGGSYSLKFPDLSKELLNNKLARLENSGAELLVTDCPGCVMQLRGGEERRGRKLKVEHLAEFLARQLK